MKELPHAVLFDLDGTLVDSAPDLAAAGNEMRSIRGLPPLPYAAFRPMVGSGARGIVGVALQVTPTDPSFEALRTEFLDRYERRLTEQTHVFPEMANALETLMVAGIPWGIVTNKAARLATPLVRALGLEPKASVLVCGDTAARAKPFPDPLLEAARRMGVAPGECIYVGDDHRDVEAGRAAGMGTVIAAWGYLGLGEPIEAWGADHIVDSPRDLLKLLAIA